MSERLREPEQIAASTAWYKAASPSSGVLAGKLSLRDRLLSEITWRGDEVVADLGAGAGLLAVGAARRTTGTVHAIDLFIGKDLLGNSERRLRANAAMEGVADRIQVHRQDRRATGLPAGCVDVVFSSLCLHNLGSQADRQAALDEITRILRPDGTVVISDLAHVDDEYRPRPMRAGFDVRAGSAPATFPPQRTLIARRP